MAMQIVIQAGGKGTRLEKYTRNKPKCLVSVNNKPMLFYIFEKFPQAEFHIICDYKREVLAKYLQVFAKDYNYHLIPTDDKGTCAGIAVALDELPEDEPFLLIWSDLILADDWEMPENIDKNYIGIAKEFECRWSYVG